MVKGIRISSECHRRRLGLVLLNFDFFLQLLLQFVNSLNRIVHLQQILDLSTVAFVLRWENLETSLLLLLLCLVSLNAHHSHAANWTSGCTCNLWLLQRSHLLILLASSMRLDSLPAVEVDGIRNGIVVYGNVTKVLRWWLVISGRRQKRFHSLRVLLRNRTVNWWNWCVIDHLLTVNHLLSIERGMWLLWTDTNPKRF